MLSSARDQLLSPFVPVSLAELVGGTRDENLRAGLAGLFDTIRGVLPPLSSEDIGFRTMEGGTDNPGWFARSSSLDRPTVVNRNISGGTLRHLRWNPASSAAPLADLYGDAGPSARPSSTRRRHSVSMRCAGACAAAVEDAELHEMRCRRALPWPAEQQV
ncbi:hypothetical protein ACIQVT_21775 [Streptomyces sp. NPDC100445]|uniref:hypothetical protein n=1 Tax=Streptomyces sp. NPDC100445 TaxID=3366102 RepID=UPI0037F70343